MHHQCQPRAIAQLAADGGPTAPGRRHGFLRAGSANTNRPSPVFAAARLARRLWRGLELFASAQDLFARGYLVGRAGVDTVGAPRTIEVGLAFDSAPR